MKYATVLFLFLVLSALLGCQPADSVESGATAVAPTRAGMSAVALAPVATESAPAPSPTAEASTPTRFAPPTATVAAAPTTAASEGQAREPVWGYRIIDKFPHDASAYTQGLVVDQDPRYLLEGTGRDSFLRRFELESGEVIAYRPLDDQYFGEGITLFDEQIIQLTWQAGQGFVYDADDFELVGEFTYPHEGWGITHDGQHLIVSDGSDIIRFWDPATFEEVRRVAVRSSDGPVTQLNELEYVEGEIWANVWFTDLIARISPADGRVLGWVDLSGILQSDVPQDPQGVLNGIAYDAENERLFVTGKLWPAIFEIEVLPEGAQ